ncbi:MAG: glutamate--tRNA ligase [Acidobacteria bacterium]|nr:MAG: glutamate--tRNA ligase [Acidobacteriota bacterium]
MEAGNIRVRFAPSPTGYVHVGNARTALFNWLFARHNGGKFVLRIEDTDVERSEQRYETQLVEDLKWFGLNWDEGPDCGGPYGPYRQSARQDLYRNYSLELIEKGRAYYCFCSPEQLEEERQQALKAGQQPRYSGRCSGIPKEDAARRVAAGEPAAIRLKIMESAFAWRDLVHGDTSFPGDVIGDPILVRSGGAPAYNFAVVVDDHLMNITHVIRGDDHISNTPRQLALYNAYGWQPPQFAHLSTILGGDRARLSKRHGATSLESFRGLGILPEALRNYLTLLGWSPADGKTEILSTEELVQQFSLDHIIKSAAVFDQEKLNWLNRHYLKQLPLDKAAEMAAPFLVKARLVSGPLTAPVMEWIELVTDSGINKIDYLSQLPDAVRLIFEYDARNAAKLLGMDGRADKAGEDEVLRRVTSKILEEQHLTYPRFREILKEVQKETGRKGKELFHPVRVAMTAADSGPELEKLVPILEKGAELKLEPPVKSVADRLREFSNAAHLFSCG